MKDWRGCRGLDPPVALAVENSMPPYLIGIEASGMNPSSAPCFIDNSGCGAAMTACGPIAKPSPTPFEVLTASLNDFAQRMSASGQIVTDEMLQKEARRVVYCDDDPRNQTPADNPSRMTWAWQSPECLAEPRGYMDSSPVDLGCESSTVALVSSSGNVTSAKDG